jgi:4-hydroxymandelate oxidase
MTPSPRPIPTDIVCLDDYARHFMDHGDEAIRAYICGGAGDGLTMADNRHAFDRLRLMPRMMARMEGANTRCRLFGDDYAHPVFIAPCAYHRLVDDDGEISTAMAATLTDTCMTVSTQSSVRLEDVAAAGTAPLWFQLYLQPRRRDTLSLVRRVENAGYKALVLTIDAVVSGNRYAATRAGFALPPHVSAVNLEDFPPSADMTIRPGGSLLAMVAGLSPTFDDLEWLCRQTDLPVLVKGVLNPADVAACLNAGVAGIVVSNHGGRVLDTLPAALDMLPAIVAAVAGRVPVLMDGGVRRGTDIVKAIALGACAIFVGQPILHALAVAGASGVVHAITILRSELETAMTLLGTRDLQNLDSSYILLQGGR